MSRSEDLKTTPDEADKGMFGLHIPKADKPAAREALQIDLDKVTAAIREGHEWAAKHPHPIGQFAVDALQAGGHPVTDELQPRRTGTEAFAMRYGLGTQRIYASHAIAAAVESGDASPLVQAVHKNLNDPQWQPAVRVDLATVLREQAEMRQESLPTLQGGEA